MQALSVSYTAPAAHVERARMLLGYHQERWTTARLAAHLRKHAVEAGHPSLAKLGRGTVSKILSEHELRPHKVTYYLEGRDAEFECRKADVLRLYRLVALLRAAQ